MVSTITTGPWLPSQIYGYMGTHIGPCVDPLGVWLPTWVHGCQLEYAANVYQSTHVHNGINTGEHVVARRNFP